MCNPSFNRIMDLLDISKACSLAEKEYFSIKLLTNRTAWTGKQNHKTQPYFPI